MLPTIGITWSRNTMPTLITSTGSNCITLSVMASIFRKMIVFRDGDRFRFGKPQCTNHYQRVKKATIFFHEFYFQIVGISQTGIGFILC